MTAGKRNVQQHKREKAQAKQARKAARQLKSAEVTTNPVEVSEDELLAELAAIHVALKTATMSPEEFEQRRELIRLQLEEIERHGS